jgi:hypothetical protein
MAMSTKPRFWAWRGCRGRFILISINGRMGAIL